VQHEVLVAGFGGQGVLLTGQLLAYGGLLENKEVTWFPSYGPEMRGGTANCIVVVSGKRIASPVVERPGAALVFNQPSLLKFEAKVRPGGLLLVNSTLVAQPPERKDLYTYLVPANEVAQSLGHILVANMVMLGAYLELTGAVSVSSVLKALEKNLSEQRRHLLSVNREAMERGAQLVSQRARKYHTS
jgi:2-oxoglutarate ferredoxin oxidoreductase subunit gamma